MIPAGGGFGDMLIRHPHAPKKDQSKQGEAA
jgi:hypothetical protein